MTPFALSGLLTAITSLAVGMFGLSKGGDRERSVLWFFFTGSVAIWGIGALWIGLEQDSNRALWVWRVAFAFGVTWIPCLFYHFVVRFCEISSRGALLFHYLIGGIFCVLGLTSRVFFSDVRFVFSSFYFAIPGSGLFYAFCSWWGSLVVYAHLQMFFRYRQLRGTDSKQVLFLLIAFSLAFLTGSLDYLPFFGVDLYPYGNFGIVLYPLIMLYAMGQYRFLEIRTVAHKTLLWFVVSSSIAVPVGLVLWVSDSWLGGLRPFQRACLVGTLIVLLVHYTNVIQPRIDHIFQRRRYDVQKILQRLVHELAALKDVNELMTRIADTIREATYASNTFLVHWDEKRGVLSRRTERGEQSVIVKALPPEFLTWISTQTGVIPLSAASKLPTADVPEVVSILDRQHRRWRRASSTPATPAAPARVPHSRRKR